VASREVGGQIVSLCDCSNQLRCRAWRVSPSSGSCSSAPPPRLSLDQPRPNWGELMAHFLLSKFVTRLPPLPCTRRAL